MLQVDGVGTYQYSHPFSVPGAKSEASTTSAAAVAAAWDVTSSPNGPLMILRWIGSTNDGLWVSSTRHTPFPGIC